MRSVIAAYSSKSDFNKAWVLTASLLGEIKNQDIPKPEININDLYNFLTGREQEVDAVKLEEALQYWSKETAKFRQPTQQDLETFIQLYIKDKEYEHAQYAARDAAQKLAECLRSSSDQVVAGSSPQERQQRANLLLEQSKLASQIVEKMKVAVSSQTGGWTLNDIKEDYLKMMKICKSLLLPKEIAIDSQKLLVAHFNNFKCKEEVQRIRSEAIALLYSEAGQALNYVLPIKRDEICLQLNIDDPTVKVDPHVRYLLENEATLNAQIISENRKREAALKNKK